MPSSAKLHDGTAPGVAAGILPALRSTILTIHFDEFARPQIEAPLGDFFGAGPGVNPYDSLPMTVDGDGTMTCRFPMPFAASAAIRLENRADRPVSVGGGVGRSGKG